jgi:hypothetical protein
MLEIGSVLGALALAGIGIGLAYFVACVQIDDATQRERSRSSLER